MCRQIPDITSCESAVLLSFVIKVNLSIRALSMVLKMGNMYLELTIYLHLVYIIKEPTITINNRVSSTLNPSNSESVKVPISVMVTLSSISMLSVNSIVQ